MNKKGMTLIELLAVVGILSMLILLALPASLNAYKNSKKSAFYTDIQSIYKTAVSQYQVDHYSDRNSIVYLRVNKESFTYALNNEGKATLKEEEPLELTGSTKTDFYIKLGKSAGGEVIVTEFKATNVEFQYEFVPKNEQENALTDVAMITREDVVEAAEIEETERMKITNPYDEPEVDPEG